MALELVLVLWRWSLRFRAQGSHITISGLKYRPYAYIESWARASRFYAYVA